ncbi:MAG TPA: hypothetical protein VNV15_02940 [Opitutaceae bacterium]|jgi:hypothetical protein|nr:hypothetical protein [Opitutaceae bacterium]
MKITCVIVWLILGAGALGRAETSAATTGPIPLSTGKVEIVGLKPLMVTSLDFPKGAKIDDIKIGSKIVQVDFDPKKNQLNIYPTVTEGMTNLNVRMGDNIYTFLLKILNTGDPVFQRSYTFEDEADDFDGALASAPIMKPFEVDTVAAIKTIERARFDPSFRQTIPEFRTLPVGRTVFWNDSPVTLVDVSQFADRDLLVFKVEWSNNTGNVLNLDSGQIGLKVANTTIPITCSQQVAAQLFPGQCDTIWLFVQGYRLSPHNEWRLLLPPDAASVQKLFPRR